MARHLWKEHACQLRTLENGLDLLWVELPHLHTAALNAYVRLGPAYEQPESAGVSHLLEHLHMSCSPLHPTRSEMSQAFAEIPGDRNATTFEDVLEFNIDTTPQACWKAAELLADSLQVHRYSDEIIETERALLLSELLQENDAGKGIEDLLIGESAATRSARNSRTSIPKISRDEIERFNRLGFTPKRMCVVLAGRLPEGIVDHCAEHFGRLEDHSLDSTWLRRPESPQPALPLQRSLGFSAFQRIGVLGWYWPHPLVDRSLVALRFLDFGFTSPLRPLFERLRYGSASTYWFASHLSPPGPWTTYLLCGSAGRPQHANMLEAIVEEWSRYRSEDPDLSWINQAREFYRHMVLSALDTPSLLAHRIGYTHAAEAETERSMGIDRELQLIDELDEEDLLRTAREELTPERTFVFYEAGPFGFSSSKLRKTLQRCRA